MKLTWKAYICITIVFVVSISAAIYLPIGDITQVVVASPAAIALIAALYQIIRDEAKFQKDKRLKEEERFHALSVSSHMAVVAFDKHAEFSERYLEEIRQSMPAMFTDGPTKEALHFANRLRDIRLDYSAWVARDTEEALTPFEKALRKIGLNEYSLEGTPVGDRRNRMIDEVDDLFTKVLELGKDEDSEEVGVSKAVSKIQDLLGINELTMLRKRVLTEANKALQATSASARRLS